MYPRASRRSSPPSKYRTLHKLIVDLNCSTWKKLTVNASAETLIIKASHANACREG